MYSPTQGRRGQGPGTEPQKSIPQETCQHAGKEHGWEVVVEVEDAAHQEEREVMERPSQEQLAASSQQQLGQPLQLCRQLYPSLHGDGNGAAREEVEDEAHQVEPPDHRVAEQIDSEVRVIGP